VNLQEIEILITALAYYEKHGLIQDGMVDATKHALRFSVSGMDDPAPYINEALIEYEQKQERVVKLRAKLIDMKDKAIVEELA